MMNEEKRRQCIMRISAELFEQMLRMPDDVRVIAAYVGSDAFQVVGGEIKLVLEGIGPLLNDGELRPEICVMYHQTPDGVHGDWEKARQQVEAER